MFSLINLIISVVILIRLYKYDKFYMITYDMHLKEDYNYKHKNKDKKP